MGEIQKGICLDALEDIKRSLARILFKDLWQSLGFSVDWSLQYETINPMVQRISQKSFIRLLKDGKAYMKESPVLWCTECQTSIAQAELEAIEKDAAFNYIHFKVGEDRLIVATTRPELLYGCVCLFVNPEDDRYIKYIGKKANVPLYDYEIPVLTKKLILIKVQVSLCVQPLVTALMLSGMRPINCLIGRLFSLMVQ